MQLRTLALASTAIVALGLASSAAPVTTTTTTTTTTTEPVEGKKAKAKTAKKTGHCVTSLTKPGNPTTCYDTFTAAIAAATGGKVTDAPADPRVAMNDKALLTRLNASGDKKSSAANQPLAEDEAMVFLLYCNTGFRGCIVGGGVAIWTGRPCTGSDTSGPIDWQVPYVGDEWNDWGESFQAFQNCWAKVFEHANFGGASLDWAPERSDLGVLEDEVSSFQLT
jgi:hypothetical protein